MSTTAVVVLAGTVVGVLVIAGTRRRARAGPSDDAPAGMLGGRAGPLGAVDAINALMPAVVSLVLLAGAFYVILSDRYDADTAKWAFATVGTVAGYWLGTRSG